MKKIFVILAFCLLLPIGTEARKKLVPRWADTITLEQKAAIKEIIENMVFVRGGERYIGNAEHPQPGKTVFDTYRKVSVSDFYIGKYEVRQKDYDAVMGPRQRDRWSDPDNPESGISWFDFQRFIERLSSLSGLPFRMPTETEWEYAATGGQLSKHFKYAGGNDYQQVGWLKPNSGDSIHRVGQMAPNELGLYDMTGNVVEFTLDNYRPYPETSYERDYFYNDGGSVRSVMGSNFMGTPERAFPYMRMGMTAQMGFSLIGMRLALGDGVKVPEIEYPKPFVMRVFQSHEMDSSLVVGVKEEDKTQFMKGSWDEVLQYAQLMKKAIFVDCYTKWCGPCKVMDQFVFPTKQMGADFLNKRFVNVKMDMESEQGKLLNKEFHVGSYPTFLILSPDGKKLESFSGLNNVQTMRNRIDSLISLHPEYDEAFKRNPEPMEIDSTDFVPGRETVVHHLLLADATAKAKAEGKRLVMLDCSTSWCGHCKVVEKRIFPLASVGDLLNKDCIVNYMDMEGEEGKALGQKFDITAYPVFLFLDLDGNEVGRVSGSGSAKVLKLRWYRAMNGLKIDNDI